MHKEYLDLRVSLANLQAHPFAIHFLNNGTFPQNLSTGQHIQCLQFSTILIVLTYIVALQINKFYIFKCIDTNKNIYTGERICSIKLLLLELIRSYYGENAAT